MPLSAVPTSLIDFSAATFQLGAGTVPRRRSAQSSRAAGHSRRHGRDVTSERWLLLLGTVGAVTLVMGLLGRGAPRCGRPMRLSR